MQILNPCHACRRAEDPDLEQKLVLRLQQLCQLEALLNRALNYAPPTLELPTCQGTLASLPTASSGPKVGPPHVNLIWEFAAICLYRHYDHSIYPEYISEQAKKKAKGKEAQAGSERPIDDQTDTEEQSLDQKENTPSNTHQPFETRVERQEER